MKRFLDLADFNREQILDLLKLAQSLLDRPEPKALAGNCYRKFSAGRGSKPTSNTS